MNDRVHASPTDLKNLRRELERMQNDVDAAVKRVRGALARADWDDAVRRDFERRFDEVVKALGRFKTEADALRPVLDRKARDLEAFLRR